MVSVAAQCGHIGLGNTYSSYPVNNHYDAKNTYKDGYLFDLNKYPIDTGPRYDDSFFGVRKSPYNYGSYGNGDYGGGRYGNGKEPYIGKDTGSPDYRYGNGKEPYIGKDTGSPDYRYGDRAGQRYDISSQDGSYNNWDNKFYGREGIDVSGQPAPRWDVSREGESSVPAPQEPVMLNTHGGKKGPQLGPRPLAAPEPTMHSGHELAMGASQSHGQISPAQHYAAGQAADNDDSNGAPYGQNLQGTQDKLPPYQPQGVQRNDMYDQSIHDSNRGGNQLQPDRNRGAVLGNRGAVLGTLGQGYQQQPYQGDVQQEAARVPPREYAPANQPPPERTGADSGAIHQEGVAAAASDPASVTPGNASSGGAAAAAEKEPGKPAVMHLHMDVQEQQVQLEEEVFSPQAAENSGAVLALSLGLAVTALLLAFVGCRLRSFKRRARRRGPLNVHDPDYLINGMYL
ncbi:PREDICTED: uncharacterized protein LOC106815317 [Priapulus caudatus]|uniref:Uncharacterized protein LOC106815317 n=1 Tax=Priapulus caudatus TaxID=37621 RepID=A0ABM1ESS6_PRICU|nr:PREDICTED: uncharacterized protein LOC106815317 [Priapulus caudatus]